MGRVVEDAFVCIDCETTGLDAEEDRVIEVAFACFKGKDVIDQYETLIDPERPIPAASMEIHHITDAMVDGQPKIEQVLPGLLKKIGKRIIIGHGVSFDVALLINAAKRHQIPCKLEQNTIIDTLRLARLYGESPVNSLEQLRQHFNIADEGAHRAMSDVLVNIEVFYQLTKQFRTTKEVLERLKKPVRIPIMPLGPHKGRPMKEVPIEYLRWMANKKFDGDLLFSVRSEIKRRSKGGLFSQETNPFADL